MTVTNSLTQESALVKTAPTSWIVIDPEEQAAIRALAPRVYAEIERRLAAGSPFETPAGAWQGEEPIESDGPVTASIAIIDQDSICVTFNTRHLDFGKLAIAKRLGKGCYEVYLSEAGFFSWVERLAPPPRTPAELVADELRAAHPELAARIDKALALVQAGTVEFPHYQTGALLTTNPPTRRCSCPDAQHRAPQITGIGQACKHCLAQHIHERVRQGQETTAYRKLTDKIEMARQRQAAAVEEPDILDLIDYPASGTPKGGDPAARATALPAWVDRKDSMEDWL